MGKMSLTSCCALSTPGKFSNVDRYAPGFTQIANAMFQVPVWETYAPAATSGVLGMEGVYHNHYNATATTTVATMTTATDRAALIFYLLVPITRTRVH